MFTDCIFCFYCVMLRHGFVVRLVGPPAMMMETRQPWETR